MRFGPRKAVVRPATDRWPASRRGGYMLAGFQFSVAAFIMMFVMARRPDVRTPLMFVAAALQLTVGTIQLVRTVRAGEPRADGLAKPEGT